MKKKLLNFWDMHAVVILPVSGLILLLIGQVMLAISFWERLATIFSSTGIALLGGSLFMAITKTTHYTKFFQDRIYDVFYSPEKSATFDLLVSKWKTLTHFLLIRTAGDLRENVANEILKRFFNRDIQHYFQEVTDTYDIVLFDDQKTASIKKRVINRMVINDNKDETILTQKIVSTDQHKLLSVYVDNKKIDLNECVTEKEITKNDKKLQFMEVKIKIPNDRRVKIIERFYEKTVDIKADPWSLVNNSKFIQQLTVKYKATNCNVTIIPTGSIISPEKEDLIYMDEDGYTRVVISPVDGLTLPGEGYILLITPLNEDSHDETI
ncbi:hypothetical protein ACYUMR_003215 [Providencia stuartii]